MRFGWLAAAAAMVCASQADAARYYEFQIEGNAIVTYFGPTTPEPNTFRISSAFTSIFDSAQPTPSGYLAPGITTLALTTAGRIYTFGGRGGPILEINVDLASLGSTFTVAGTGSYSYQICAASCQVPTPGTLTRVLGRTTDIAPGPVGTILGEATTPVPEPMSWAMVIAGLALTGAAMRRRPALRQVRGMAV